MDGAGEMEFDANFSQQLTYSFWKRFWKMNIDKYPIWARHRIDEAKRRKANNIKMEKYAAGPNGARNDGKRESKHEPAQQKHHGEISRR